MYNEITLEHDNYHTNLRKLGVIILPGNKISLKDLPQHKVDRIVDALDRVDPYGYKVKLQWMDEDL